MLNRKLVIVLMAFVVFGFLGCGGGDGDDGGGGGGNTPITNTRTYFTIDDGYFEPGYRLQFNVTGTSNTRDVITGTYSLSTKEVALLDGEPVIPVERMINLTYQNQGLSTTSLSTIYYDTNHDPVMSYESIQGITCVPTGAGEMSGIGKIGDFGQLPTWECDNGSVDSGTWILEPGPEPYAIYTTTWMSRDYLGRLVSTEITRITIDEGGDPKSATLELSLANGVNLSLSGVRVLK